MIQFFTLGEFYKVSIYLLQNLDSSCCGDLTVVMAEIKVTPTFNVKSRINLDLTLLIVITNSIQTTLPSQIISHQQYPPPTASYQSYQPTAYYA